ncbi:MAG: MmcQ/YjbR family DNA-binding protein [Flavobacteriales bacterium]|nr:MmcQ/YjbR family DNA-binding protein [Flavobacteriales bacterium]
MNIESLRDICIALPHVTEDIKWGNNLTFLIAEKMFLITNVDDSPARASFKVPTEEFEDLVERDGIIQAPYFAKNQWVLVQDINTLTYNEWKFYSKQSFELVVAKLSKKKQEEILSKKV